MLHDEIMQWSVSGLTSVLIVTNHMVEHYLLKIKVSTLWQYDVFDW